MRKWISKLLQFMKRSSTVPTMSGRVSTSPPSNKVRKLLDATTPNRADPVSAGTASRPYLRFRNVREDATFTAHPVVFMPGTYAQTAILPGSHDPLGRPGIWANDLEAKGEIEWVDDPASGLFTDLICTPQDVIGAKGTLDKVLYQFDDILQTGENILVYQLTNLETCDFLAYGFNRDLFDARHALIRYLRRTAEGKLPYFAPAVVSLADRVLQAFPTDETAVFNKGVALLVDKQFAEAHKCFSLAIDLNSEDQLAILHDGAALAGLGEHAGAIHRLLTAYASSPEVVGQYLTTFAMLRNMLSVSVQESIRLEPTRADVGALWLQHFYSAPDEQTSSASA